MKHINDPLPLPKALKPDISDDLNRVILKALAKDPNDRYQKVADLTADLRKAMGMSPEDSQPDAAKGSGIKLAGATMVGRVGGGVTPPPRPAPVGTPQEQSGTQVAAPKTVVAGAAVVPAISPCDSRCPVAAKKRPGWIIPLAIVAVFAIVGVGVVAVHEWRRSAAHQHPRPCPRPKLPLLCRPPTEAPTNTPTAVPLTDSTAEVAEGYRTAQQGGQ